MAADARPIRNFIRPNPWLIQKVDPLDSGVRLFCFPHAGASAAVYRAWPKALMPAIQVYPVEIPGRATRAHEPCLRDLDMLVAAAHGGLQKYFDRPFALFGHSMGALIAYELARSLSESQIRYLVGLIVSGRRAPHIANTPSALYNLNGDEAITTLRKLGGTPQAILEDQSALETLLPIIRADFEMVRRYKYRSGAKLCCSIVTMNGAEDHQVSKYDIEEWQACTNGQIRSYTLPGNHFFLESQATAALELLRTELGKCVMESQARMCP
jgi:medium-chain acyl-[acyl-carrier-protein] hydrolase